MTSDLLHGSGEVGFEFVGAVFWRRGRLVWCKTNPLPGEKANGVALADVPLSPVCFGSPARR